MIEAVQQFFTANPFVAGLGGATAAGYLISHIKELPMKVFEIAAGQVMVEVAIPSESAFFEALDHWLALHPSTKKMRRLRVTEWHERSARSRLHDSASVGLTLGGGRHIVWQDQRPFFFHRSKNEISNASSNSPRNRTNETIYVSTLGRSQQPLLDLILAVQRLRNAADNVGVYIWDGYDAALIDSRPKRPLDTIYCDETTKNDLVVDLENFFASEAKYRHRGTPYRRGYMFFGPPGTGKTSMIFALASHFERNVYLIPASAIENDKELLNAVNAARGHFVVLEDVDSVRASEDREKKAGDKDASVEVGKAGITLSGLLNALDGLGAKEGRVLFLTTNRPEALDKALIRPGRVDLAKYFGPATELEATTMFNRFYPDADPTGFLEAIRPRLPLPQADLQNLLLSGTFA